MERVERFYVKFGDLAASKFEISCGKTDRRPGKPQPATAVGVGNYSRIICKVHNMSTKIILQLNRMHGQSLGSSAARCRQEM